MRKLQDRVRVRVRVGFMHRRYRSSTGRVVVRVRVRVRVRVSVRVAFRMRDDGHTHPGKLSVTTSRSDRPPLQLVYTAAPHCHRKSTATESAA